MRVRYFSAIFVEKKCSPRPTPRWSIHGEWPQGEIVRIQLAHRGACFNASDLTIANDQGHACWMDFSEYLQRFAS